MNTTTTKNAIAWKHVKAVRSGSAGRGVSSRSSDVGVVDVDGVRFEFTIVYCRDRYDGAYADVRALRKRRDADGYDVVYTCKAQGHRGAARQLAAEQAQRFIDDAQGALQAPPCRGAAGGEFAPHHVIGVRTDA